MIGLRRGLAHGDGSHVEGRRLVGLAHVARPFRVEVEAALDAGVLRFLGLEAAVARIDVALQHQLGIGERHGVDGARLDQPHRRALHRAGDADLVAAHRQHRIVEAGARQQRAGRRHAEAHGDRNRLVRLVVLVDHLPHVRAGRDLERADIAPAEVHAVVAEVGAAIEFGAGHAADAGAHGELGLVGGVPDRHHVLVHVLRDSRSRAPGTAPPPAGSRPARADGAAHGRASCTRSASSFQPNILLITFMSPNRLVSTR